MRNTFLCAAVVILGCGFVLGQQYKVLWNFTGGSDGGGPYASLIADGEGNLYGTTTIGGAFSWGTVFELTPDVNGNWQENVLGHPQ
jgi:uncharacterized repeat protein (TIGR03803 family)